MRKKTIMICDDEPGIHESLRIYLTKEGFEVISVFRGDQLEEAFFSMRPDLLVLDIMLPGKNGTDLCRDIRAKTMPPIIMLTAKGEELDRLLGFALGADDYIVKPFSPREVISRIQVIFRRLTQIENGSAQSSLTVGNTEISLRTYEVRCDGEALSFSPKEVEILHLLASAPGQVFSREQILDNVWGFDFDGDTRAVDTHIKRIRKKMPEHASIALRAVYGIGYKVEVA